MSTPSALKTVSCPANVDDDSSRESKQWSKANVFGGRRLEKRQKNVYAYSV
jgi:hypothetical protein